MIVKNIRFKEREEKLANDFELQAQKEHHNFTSLLKVAMEEYLERNKG